MSNESPALTFRTHQNDGGVIVGIKGEDTKQSLFDLLVEKYGERLDVETTLKLNGGAI